MEAEFYLIKETYTKDAIGQSIPTEQKRLVFCHTESVSLNEIDTAGRMGLRADSKIITQAVNYSGEKIAEYNGERYGIYRSYRSPESDEIELYLEKKGGV